MHTAYSNFVI